MKVPRLRQDADVARVAVARHGAARRSLVPQRVEHRGAVDDTARHQMDDTLLAALHFALDRSEEHTSELQSLMRTSYAVFCLKKKKQIYKDYCTQSSNKTNTNAHK